MKLAKPLAAKFLKLCVKMTVSNPLFPWKAGFRAEEFATNPPSPQKKSPKDELYLVSPKLERMLCHAVGMPHTRVCLGQTSLSRNPFLSP